MYKITGLSKSFGVVAQLVEGGLLGNAEVCQLSGNREKQSFGVVAQLVEHLLCKQGVVSSSLISSTKNKCVKGGEYTMVKVLVRDNNVEQALRVAKRKSQKEGLYREMKERQRYEKPTTKRKRLREEAVRNEKKRQSKQRMVFGF